MGDATEIILERLSSLSSSRRVVPIQNEPLESQTQFQRDVELAGFPPQYRDVETPEHVQLPAGTNHDTSINMQGIMGSSRKEQHNQDDWLPITESRRGNAFTAAFHLLCSGIGIQALVLPVAFISLGWLWGTLCLLLVFAWQLYTTWLLVNLHEPIPGTRFSRYIVLSIIAFGPKLGKLLAIFPTMYLSGGTCVMFIITGGATMELLNEILCGDDPKCNGNALTGAEWFLIFVCTAIFVSQFFPSLNSLAPVSLIGSTAGVVYLTLLWTLSVSKGKLDGVSHEPSKAAASEIGRIRGVINALGIIAIAFRGHNVVLEIQGTLPTDPQRPSRRQMWRGVTASYLLIPICLLPLAIGGYWAYGNSMPANGILYAVSDFRGHSTSKSLRGAICLIMLIHLLCAFQIYAMPVFDNLERIYISKKNKPCPRWVRSAIRVFFGGLTYFISMAFPFLGSLGPLVGAITLPLTLAYPCFMWVALKRPKPLGSMWCLNIGLGSLGIVMSVLLAAAALWNLVARGLDANFFNPH